MQFNFDNNIPIYIQLVEHLKRLIVSGALTAGERLPSVRELAAKSRTNPNTVQKALSELEEMGLIYTERTNGKFVTDKKDKIESFREEYAASMVKRYFSDMQSIGFSATDAITYLQELKGEKK